MHKVVIERPRWNPGPGKNGRRANLPDEILPKFEGIKRPHSRRKGLTDLLGPLRRWLRSQVGRPWNDVYSEACAVIKPDSVIRAHVKTHLLRCVERNAFMHGGKVCALDTGYRGRGIVPLEDRLYGWSLFFVHPETGLLQAIPQASRRARRDAGPKPPVTIHWLRKNVAVQIIRGLWFECHYELVPFEPPFSRYDHALERVLTRKDAHDAWFRRYEKPFKPLPDVNGPYHICTWKRQLSKNDLRRLGLRNSAVTTSKPSAVFETFVAAF